MKRLCFRAIRGDGYTYNVFISLPLNVYCMLASGWFLFNRIAYLDKQIMHFECVCLVCVIISIKLPFCKNMCTWTYLMGVSNGYSRN